MSEAIFNIRPAQLSDVDSIAALFESVYDGYPDQVYRNPDQLNRMIRSTNSTDIFVIELLNGWSTLTQTAIIGTGSIHYTANKTVAELAKAVVDPDYQGLRHPTSRQSAYQSLLTTRIDRAYQTGAKILRTQANSSVHAITQREHHKQGFVPVGISKGRYREVFAGKGREHIVFMMDTASTYRPAENSDTVTLYLHPKCVPFVEHIVDSFHTSTGHALPRNICSTISKRFDQEVDDWSFSLKTTIDRCENLSLNCNVSPSDDGIPMEAIVNKIGHLVDDFRIEFASVALDANHPSAPIWYSKLANLGFQIEAFEPDLLRNGSIRDRLRLQRPPERTSKAQFIDPALELLDRQSIPYELPSDPEPIPVSDVTEVVL